MTVHRKGPLTASEIAHIREAVGAGESPVRTAARIGRSVRSIQRALGGRLGQRSARQASAVHASDDYRAARRDDLRSRHALRPPHIRAEAFTDEWWLENQRAFEARMRQHHADKEITGASYQRRANRVTTDSTPADCWGEGGGDGGA